MPITDQFAYLHLHREMYLFFLMVIGQEMFDCYNTEVNSVISNYYNVLLSLMYYLQVLIKIEMVI